MTFWSRLGLPGLFKKPPTRSIEALSSFSQGRALFESYLETGNWDDLTEARECFDLALAQDSSFDTAKFYRAVTQIEQGTPDDAINDLEALAESPMFETDARVQLANARARKGEYVTAREELRKAQEQTTGNKSTLIGAYSAALQALQGAVEHKPELWSTAIEAAQSSELKISRNDEIGVAVRFEAKSAAGTAYMWQFWNMTKQTGTGQLTEEAKAKFRLAEEAFKSAQALRPNSPRALYNLARLYICRGDREISDPEQTEEEQKKKKEDQRKWYELAEDLVSRVLEITPLDDIALATAALLRTKTEKRKTFPTLAAHLGTWLSGAEAKETIHDGLEQLTDLKGLHSVLLGDVPIARRATRDMSG